VAIEYGGTLPARNERYDVAVVEPDARHRMRIGTQLAGAEQFSSIEDLVQHLRTGRPLVAVFGPGLAVPYGFQQVHRLISAYPELGAVFAVEEVTTELLQQALRAGARDAVPVQDAESLGQAVERVGAVLTESSSRVPAIPTARPAPGRLIVVFSTKGGVGKSTIAVNVAVSMARHTSERIALVDADLQFGDVAVLLGIPPQHTVLDAAATADLGDAELLLTMLARHESGLLVLPAPTDPTGAPMLAEEMRSVCRALRLTCSHVVVDMPAQFDEVTLALVEAADDVLLVGGLDIPSVKNLKIGMQALDLAAVAGPKLRLVLNRANTQVKLDVREVEQVLGLRAEFPIPSDIAVPLSVNAGIPVVDHAPRSAATRALDHIATSLLGASDASRGKTKKRRGRRRKGSEERTR